MNTPTPERKPDPAGSPRIWHAAVIMAILLGLFAYRLFSLQVLRHPHFAALAERNYDRTISLPSLRGRIFDREGRLLADNAATFDLAINRRHVSRRGFETVLERLAATLDTEAGELRKRWGKASSDRYGDRVVARDVSYETVVRVEERAETLPGVRVIERPRRWTVYGEVGAHLLGYVGEISQSELESPAFASHSPGDEVGRGALEKTFEHHLHGTDGHTRVCVYANGLVKEEIPGSRQDPSPGHDLILTVDWDLVMAAQEILGSTPGALVAMDPNTGEIIAMASYPSYDPNVFARRLPERVDILTRKEGRAGRLVNIATEAYPPGSVYKIPLALAALEHGDILPTTTHHCSGLFRIKNWSRPWRCHIFTNYGIGHGTIDLYEAIKRSCDCYFYNMGRRLGVDKLDTYSASFGFGERTGIRLPHEKKGFRPSVESKRAAIERFGGKGDPTWYPGDTIHASIGQGMVTATPLQVTNMIAMVANGGTLQRPILVSEVRSAASETVERTIPRILPPSRRIDRAALEAIHEALDRTVNEPHGTAYACRLEGIRVCGKTGTAQNEIRDKDHAWFTCFAPREDPQVAVTVLCLWSGHGGSVAAPRAMEFLRRYFEKYPPSQEPHPNPPRLRGGS